MLLTKLPTDLKRNPEYSDSFKNRTEIDPTIHLLRQLQPRYRRQDWWSIWIPLDLSGGFQHYPFLPRAVNQDDHFAHMLIKKHYKERSRAKNSHWLEDLQLDLQLASTVHGMWQYSLAVHLLLNHKQHRARGILHFEKLVISSGNQKVSSYVEWGLDSSGSWQ